MKRVTRNRLTTRSTQRLVRRALRRWDTDQGWRAIVELQRRGSPKTLALATAMSRRASWRQRSLGLYVASQLRQRGAAFSPAYALEATQALLLAGLHDARDEVVRAAVSGLGHRPHPAALDDLVRLSSHRNSLFRFSVAVALGSYQEHAATEALLRLMRDPDSDVRDWATFGVGTMQTADSPEIRAALWVNLKDKDAEVRGEALVGLAERRDERVVEYLQMHLGPDCRVYELDAARMLGDVRLLTSLQTIAGALDENEKSGYWFESLSDAIAACSGPNLSPPNHESVA